MTLTPKQFRSIRDALASIPGDVSNDAVGDHAPKLDDMYAPEAHATALDPTIPIVVGSRGAGKSFWSGVLGQDDTREAAAVAYPRLHLNRLKVAFGYTGAVGGAQGVSTAAIESLVPQDPSIEEARSFWWATVIRASSRSVGESMTLREAREKSLDWEMREELLASYEDRLRIENRVLLVVYDALDTVATSWPRLRLLTEALLEVVWGMRAYRSIKLKLFIRPDQIDDDSLRFVEIPKLRTGAVRITWSGADLYGLLFSRLMQAESRASREAFEKLLSINGIEAANRKEILARRWQLASNTKDQAKVMAALAGPYMADTPSGFKKGKTYDWPIKHLGDAYEEVTPRSFLGLIIAAAKRGEAPPDRSITADGIRHGLREASKTRVDQLHLEFPWIKGVLAPLAGLLLPQYEDEVFEVWKRARTIKVVREDATKNKYLPPFPVDARPNERTLFEALKRIGVMFRREDDRIDMPDLFRVAARLLKKGGIRPSRS